MGDGCWGTTYKRVEGFESFQWENGKVTSGNRDIMSESRVYCNWGRRDLKVTCMNVENTGNRNVPDVGV